MWVSSSAELVPTEAVADISLGAHQPLISGAGTAAGRDGDAARDGEGRPEHPDGAVERFTKLSPEEVDDWGYTREKSYYEWEDAPLDWSRSMDKRGDDAGWTTPDWATTGVIDTRRREPCVDRSSKDFIAFDGVPVLMDTREEVDLWCDGIRASGVRVLGFDTEWKPERMRGQNNPIALIQFCYRKEEEEEEDMLQGPEHEVVLIHSIKTGITPKLKSILEDSSIVKAGVDLTCDSRKLEYHFDVNLQGGIELDLEYSRMVDGGKQRVGMKKLVKLVLGKEMKKVRSLTTYNWERQLTYAAIQYGALDAYVCSRVYEKMFGQDED